MASFASEGASLATSERPAASPAEGVPSGGSAEGVLPPTGDLPTALARAEASAGGNADGAAAAAATVGSTVRVAAAAGSDDDEEVEAEDDFVPPSQRLVVPSDVTDLSDVDMEALYYIGTSGLKLTRMTGLEHLVKLQTLSFRSNFLRQLEGTQTLTALTSLELYENRLKTVDGVQHLVGLTNLDLSYNRLGKLKAEWLRPLTRLRRLYVAQNRISEIGEGLATLTSLEVLDLGMNRIRIIDGLDSLGALQELWLGKNKIKELRGLDSLTKLVRLSVQSNRLTRIGTFGLNQLACLEELYLSHQGIVCFEGRVLANLSRLNTLDLSHNFVTTTEGLPCSAVPLLEELWMSSNRIASYDDVERLRPLERLKTLYLEHNPISKDFEYRKRLALFLPSLTQIDAVRCR